MHPSPLRYYPGSCFVVHAGEVPCTGQAWGACWIDLGKLAGQDQNCKNLQNAPQSSQRSSPSKTCNWPIYAQGPDPRREKQLWEVWGGFRGPRLAGQWARFSIAVCMEKVITTPSREPVPRPRKGNPLGGPVRGIFISSPSHWPVSATVESRESGVVVVQGWWHW
jgi:hypothetical protein